MTAPEESLEPGTSRLFRRESIQRLNSPERLDELMRVVGAKSWIALAATGALVVLALLWSVLGRVPVSVEGRGVLIHPRRVVEVQSPVAGPLASVRVAPGQAVTKGDVLAVLDASLLRKQLSEKRGQLSRRRKQHELNTRLHAERVRRDQEGIQRERELLTRQISESTEQADYLRDAGAKALSERRATLQDQLKLFQQLSERLEARVTKFAQLEKSGVVNKQELLQLEQTTMNTLLTCQSLETQLQDLTVSELKDRDLDLQRRHRILDMQNRLQDLVRKETRLAHEAAQFTINTDEPVEVLEEELRLLEVQLNASTILSPYSGRVLEVVAVQSQVVGAGSRLAVLEIEDPDKPLVAVTCFQIKDGKRVRPGLELRVTPSTVQRARFGSLRGTVTTVGAFPVTSEELGKIVGNAELAKTLVPANGGIVVFGALELDAATTSGYAWSSGEGPPLRPTPGTTTSVRVVVERRSPLSFVLPILRASVGTE